ncbi:MAG: hypothetical protein D6760_10340 [Deltaproteobacteria bacterium]|nr:MAG: hypothetical protein D6760_10340 [Deltaproteobacteria bacterium]
MRPHVDRPATSPRPAEPRTSASPLLPQGSPAAVARRAAAAADRERLDRSDVRAMLETALAAMIPERTFSDEEAERLTDAVMRIRAARRVLRRVSPSIAAADVLARERTVLTEALADFQEISGLDPSELTEILEPEGGLSNDEDPAQQPPVSPEDRPPEYLRDLDAPQR